MPKQRARFIIATYEGETIDWGLIIGVALREQVHGVRQGKPMKPIFAQWLSILCPRPVATQGRQTLEKEQG